MAYRLFEKEKPVSSNGADIKVIVRVCGLSMTASDYETYKVVSWREKINCFIDWEYNAKGEFDAVKYNDPNSRYIIGQPYVTHWDYLKEVPKSRIKD